MDKQDLWLVGIILENYKQEMMHSLESLHVADNTRLSYNKQIYFLNHAITSMYEKLEEKKKNFLSYMESAYDGVDAVAELKELEAPE